MATVNPTIRYVGNDTVVFTWTLTNADNDGAPIGPNHSDYADRTVQAAGTFGGATVAIQGSNDDGVTWFTVDDPQGTDLTMTTAGGKAIIEVTERMRPLLTGGAASSVTVSMICLRQRSYT